MKKAPAASSISFILNGAKTTVHVHPLRRLLDVLREECGLTGTKEGCGEGECGACTVVVNGKAVNACLVPIAQVRDAKVQTIEGLKGRHPLQQTFVSQGGAQCGICTPGMIMAAVALGPRPTLEQVRTGLAGNLCRCTGYMGIYRAIKEAARISDRTKRAGGKTGTAVRARAARTPSGTAGSMSRSRGSTGAKTAHAARRQPGQTRRNATAKAGTRR